MANGPLVVEVLDSPTEEHVTAFARLLPQLSSAPPPDLATLRAITSHEGTAVLLAIDEGTVVGTLTLHTFRIPTGVRAWIEDVVVDQQLRSRGAGTALVERALEIAGEHGAVTVELTSRPSREAANRLYRRLGFVERETNVYRISLES